MPLITSDALANTTVDFRKKSKKAKNIIMLVSDGMSTGTLNMTDMFLNRKTGNGSNWLNLYREEKVTRALMDTASASSIVTDSAAASSSWGGGVRVPNGKLNVSASGEHFLPLWQKFKKAGCVTTVPITHATPAGLCVNQSSRKNQEGIAEQYLSLGFDVMMGGGNAYFDASKRKDGKNMYAAYEQNNYTVARDRRKMLNASTAQKLLGVFAEDGLPFALDRSSHKHLLKNTPGIAEMTATAITHMKDHEDGFVLLVEGGKVDWAAHANDLAALVYDQVAFDEAIKVAIDFAEKDEETLVIITTDHGNANPGIIYGSNANANFDSLQTYNFTNDWILNGIHETTSKNEVIERVAHASGYQLTTKEAQTILSYYTSDVKGEDGLYNPKKLPFKVLSEIQKKHTSVGWISMQHSADYVELAMFGPGSHLLHPFVKNTDLHLLMLKAAEVANVF